MPERPTPAYPQNYTPSDLDIHLDMFFVDRSGTEFRPPDMRLPAGVAGTWTLRFENRGETLQPGAVITLVRFNYQIAFGLQTEDSHRRDYCTFKNESAATISLAAWRDSVNLISLHVEAGEFKPGDACTVTVGDSSGGGAGSETFWSTTDGTFLVAVDPDGSGNFKGTKNNPYEFTVIPGTKPDLLRLLGPSVAKIGDPFALHLGVFDLNRNLVETFTGTVVFNIPDGLTGLPNTYRFTSKDAGLKIFEDISITHPGIYRIGLHVQESDKQFLSNPTVASNQPKASIYWGDVHAHGWGDSTMHLMHVRTEKLDPLSRHLQGKQIGRFDFACPASMSMDPDKREETWEPYREACEQLDEPGTYVPFLAYEAHPRAGDRQIFFKNYKNEPLPPSMRLPMEEVDTLYGEREDAILQVHIGGAPPLWDQYKPARERFLEVCSGFGCAEWLLQHALRLGYRPGVCAASDLHLGLMGGPRAVEPFRGRFGQKYPMNHRDSAYGTGPVTAIVAPQLHRDALWNSIETRNTYATSGARIYLNVTGNGSPAGSDIHLDDTFTLSITCHGCAPIERIELIAGEHCVKTFKPGDLDFQETVSFQPNELPGTWLYLRVSQTDGEYAWSSPLYLHHRGPLPIPGNLPTWNAQEPLDLAALNNADAARYLPDLQAYLNLEEDPDRFQDLTPIGLLDLSMGRCALFYCYWSTSRYPMSIRWFYEFDIPRIRYDLGWRDYGAFDENNLGPQLMAQYNK
ncbi:MAG: DUF3604 domain-containing protein [bacterium]|nr:DUF3604 domain-containing protein [bacterium]